MGCFFQELQIKQICLPQGNAISWIHGISMDTNDAFFDVMQNVCADSEPLRKGHPLRFAASSENDSWNCGKWVEDE